MGTRGLTGIKIDGEKKYTYNHFDSYFDSLGEEVVNFCNETEDWEEFKENARRVKLVKKGQIPTEEQIEKYRVYSNTGVSTGSLKDWYCLLRELQGVQILKEIRDGNVQHMIDNKDFLKNYAFCEYAYVLNFDTNMLEIYVSGKKIIGFSLFEDIPKNWQILARKALPF